MGKNERFFYVKKKRELYFCPFVCVQLLLPLPLKGKCSEPSLIRIFVFPLKIYWNVSSLNWGGEPVPTGQSEHREDQCSW